MTKRTTILGLLLGALALSPLCPDAHAGRKTAYPVTLDITNRTASGAMGTARASADANQFIGCFVIASGAAGTPWLRCQAWDAAGSYATCISSAAGYSNAVQGLTSNGYIKFQWDTAGNCSYLEIDASSNQAPITP